MSVLIKGMEIPTSCYDCPLCYDMMECSVSKIRFYTSEDINFDFCKERHPDCPLVAVLPHGRLIDADELANSITGAIYHSDLRDAPTIIPGEEGEQ